VPTEALSTCGQHQDQGSCFRLTLPRHAGHSVTHSPLGLPAETTLVDSDGVELGLDEPAEVS
jgi:hypothetical protein